MTLLRTESFVPLTATPAEAGRTDYRVQVLSQSGPTPAFEALAARPATPANPEITTNLSTCEPRISVQREGDRVVSIRVQCSCGQVMDLACVYPEAGKTA